MTIALTLNAVAAVLLAIGQIMQSHQLKDIRVRLAKLEARQQVTLSNRRSDGEGAPVS